MPKQVQLTAEQKAAIDNYGSQIKTIENFMEAVRKRPGMIIGPLGARGFLNMQREVFQNSVDTILDPSLPCNAFHFTYDERTKETTVLDYGRGFPFDDIVRILTSQYTSKNYEKRPYEYSTGLNGIGCKAVNALSSTMIVESYRYDGKAIRVEFSQGKQIGKIKSIPNKDKHQGAKVYFVPDESIMGECYLSWKRPYKLIKDIISMTPIGSTVYFEAIDMDGKVHKETIVNNDGIYSNIIAKVDNPIIKPIYVYNDDGYHRLEMAMCYNLGDIDNNDLDVTSYCNFCPTTGGGTHVDGCIDGITKWFTQYMNNIFLANQKSKDKLSVKANDIKMGLNMMINAAVLEPQFDSQAKDELSNPDMVGYCKDIVMKGLDEWSKANPQDLQKLCKFFKEMAEFRVRQEAGKAKIVTKYQKNPITNLPQKYKRPINKTGIELIITEGDSAAGRAEVDRDEYTQGIFPIRGKIKNAFKCSRQEFFNNEEVQGITQIVFGQEYRKGLTVDDAKVTKIIFLADM